MSEKVVTDFHLHTIFLINNLICMVWMYKSENRDVGFPVLFIKINFRVGLVWRDVTERRCCFHINTLFAKITVLFLIEI